MARGAAARGAVAAGRQEDRAPESTQRWLMRLEDVLGGGNRTVRRGRRGAG